MRKILLVILVLLLAGIGTSYAQDPGIRDTVRFGDWGVYLPLQPATGIATVPLFVFNDEPLASMTFPLKWSGPIEISGVNFSNEVDSIFEYKFIFIDTSANRAGIGLFNLNPSVFPSGSRIIGALILIVKDTGIALIDSFWTQAPPNPGISFTSSNIDLIFPVLDRIPFSLSHQLNKPGDVNGDMLILLPDIVYFVNYLFRGGPPPANIQMSDVNLDCTINFEDLIFLVNYIFNSGPNPLPSWCSNL